MLLPLLRAMRPKQWIKNALVFAPLIFSLQLFTLSSLVVSLGAFISFCLLSSSMYLANDLYDLKQDRLHPIKRYRPIASGALSLAQAQYSSVALLILGFTISFGVSRSFALIAFLYISLVYSYSRWFKHVVVLDILCVALCIVLRAVGGIEALQILISPWLLITTLFGALFLISGKRRHELLLLGKSAVSHRATLETYSQQFLDQVIQISASGLIISYLVYTLSSETVITYNLSALVYTVPIVLFGLLRYLYLIYADQKGGDPADALLSDLPLLLSMLLWCFSVIVIIYG